MDVYAVVIAGGVGSRFWPQSREHRPKQLLEIIGTGTMIQNTVFRLQPLVGLERTLVVTNALQVEEIRRQLPGLSGENVLVEPIGRNTAPAIALAAEVLRARVGDAVMIVVPADHVVRDVAAFHEALGRAIAVAEQSGALVTLGMKPTAPETGYGYIQFDESRRANPYRELGAYPVVTFAEKPHLQTAVRFLESGDFLWNSGMFLWTVSAILGAMAEYLPDVSEEFHRLRPFIDGPEFPAAVESAYGAIRSISIDYGVMEKAANRYIVPAEFGWSDIGSWDEVYRISDKDESGNALTGTVYLEDVENCQISSNGSSIVAAIGIRDLIVIQTKDALLICERGRSQRVKNIVDFLREERLEKFL